MKKSSYLLLTSLGACLLLPSCNENNRRITQYYTPPQSTGIATFDRRLESAAWQRATNMADPNYQPTTCSSCNGEGVVRTYVYRNYGIGGPTRVPKHESCPSCGGSGLHY